MNYMKKYVNKCSLLLLMIVPLTVIGFISCNKKEDKMIIISEKKQYLGITNNEKVELTVPLYIEKSKDFYFNKEKIKSCYLKDRQNDQVYELEVNEVNKTTKKITYENKDLYAYEFMLSFAYCTKTPIRVLDAYLDLEYKDDDTCQVDIGSVLFTQTKFSNKLKVRRVKPVVNNLLNIDDTILPTTVAVMITIENTSDEEVIIQDINILNSIVTTNYQKIKQLTNLDYESNTDINKIINDEYKMVDNSKAISLEYIIKANVEINLVIPFNYLKLETVKEAGLLIRYQCQNEEENVVLDNTPLFNSSLLIPDYYIYAFVPN